MNPTQPLCQNCDAPLRQTWIDLGMQPLANAYSTDADAARNAPHYPLHARVCNNCWLVQVDSVVPPEDIFSDYAYFSSVSAGWIEHCRIYAEEIVDRFSLTSEDLVIEIASNDGYLLKHFVNKGINVLGIEPAANIAKVAEENGIPTRVEFFGADTASALVADGVQADHLSAKNVLAHVPAISDFIEGVSILLKPDAVFDVEFPHLLNTINGLQFDQIYHEHYTYLSLIAISGILERHGLRVFDVTQLPTHGGSLRVFACHNDARHETTDNVARVLALEYSAKLDQPQGYEGFADAVAGVRRHFLSFLEERRENGETVMGYGAAAKGNTFLNYAEIDANGISMIADRSDAKIGKYMPGSGIPIVSPAALLAATPLYILILPWNLKHEIASEMAEARSWGAKFVTVIPKVDVF